MAFPAVKFQLFGNRTTAVANNSKDQRVLEKNSNSHANEHHNDKANKDHLNSHSKLESKESDTSKTISTKLDFNNNENTSKQSIGHNESFKYQPSTNDLHKSKDTRLDTSIRSIESKKIL